MIYLDHAAATPLSQKALQAMLPYFTEEFFNPSAPYLPAKHVREAYEAAKDDLAHTIGAKGVDLVITAGATESINLAFTVLDRFEAAKSLVLATEHAAVLETAKLRVFDLIKVQKTGLIDLDDFRAKLSDEVALVSVSLANNELGTVQPLAEIAEIIRQTRQSRLERGITLPLYLHTDASQALSLLDINVARLGVDMLTLNAAKCGGPKGIGDSAHHPYGEKSSTELINITTKVVQRLVDWGASVILIACNTATTRCIHALRQRFPEVNFVGMEPALKSACDAGCQKIALLATPSTIRSEQVRRLVQNNIHQQDLILLPCPGLADMVESAMPKQSEYVLKPYQTWQIPEISSPSVAKIKHKLQDLVAEIPHREQVDAVVLGCTHYILIKPEIQQLFLNAQLFDGNLGTVKQLHYRTAACSQAAD